MDYTAMEEKLTGEYKEVLEKAELYGVVKNIDQDVQDEMMMNLFDLLLSAQKDGKPVEKIIGKDIETFCNDYYQEYNIKERVRRFPKKIYGVAKLTLLFELIDVFFLQGSNSSFFQAESDIAAYMVGLTGGFVMLLLIDILLQPILFKWKKKSHFLIIMLFIFLAGIVGVISITDKFSFTVKSYVVIAADLLYIMLYLLIRSIYRYKKCGTIRKIKNQEEDYGENSVLSSIGTSVQKDLPGQLVKRYESMNKKRRKKEKPEITPDEYMDILKKETENLSNTRIMMFFYIIFTAVVIIFTALTSEPEDAVVFAMIICPIELFVYKAWKKSNDGIVKSREKIFEDCKKHGCNIVEYADDINRHGCEK